MQSNIFDLHITPITNDQSEGEHGKFNAVITVI